MSTVKHIAGLALLAALVAPSVQAHYIWLERDAKGAKLYFGEVAEVREKSPGRMDDIKAPTAWAGKPESALTVSRTGTHFALAGAGQPVCSRHNCSPPKPAMK